jgi:CubicO group peptidase (beta-lactamase class C family)
MHAASVAAYVCALGAVSIGNTAGQQAGRAGAALPFDPGLEPRIQAARSMLAILAEQAVGLSVAIARDGRVLWAEAFGWRSLEDRSPATADTRFRLYSVAKPMTAVAAARLMEQRRLDADAPVQRYVPTFPDKGAPITPMQLGMHTSGIRHYTSDSETRSRQHCSTVAESVALFAADPLVHAPGAAETYSSWGYVLLSAVLEGATGQPYGAAMADLLFGPLGMQSMVIDDPAQLMRTRASFYEETSPGTFAPADPVDNTCKWGAGAWLGTAEDVARFGLVLTEGSLLQPETRQLFLSGGRIYRAQGVGAGGAAFLLVDAERRVSVALLSNAIGVTLGPALQSAMERIYQLVAIDPAAP